jgi:hypothetical protein
MDAPSGVFCTVMAGEPNARRVSQFFPIEDEEGTKGKEALMAMSMTAILLHSHAVSSDVRDALHAAEIAPLERRAMARKQAARLLVQEATLDCRDARELVDLSPGTC